MYFIKKLIFLLVFLNVVLAFANYPLKTVNVFTGVPQPSDQGPNQSGGFGDVAANVIAATEIKKRHPELTVRLLVTSAEKRYDPKVPTTIEILKIMLPELNPKLKGVPQIYEGVEVIYLKSDFYDLLEETSDRVFVKTMKRKLDELKSIIPSADLNLNFSHFPESNAIIRINAPLAMGIEEYYSSKSPINFVVSEGKNKVSGEFVEIATGATANGYTFPKMRADRNSNLNTIRTWAKANKIDLPAAEFNHTVAYSAEWQPLQVYINALEFMKPEGELILFIKYFEELDFSALPKNIKVVPLKGVPHKVMAAFIQEAAISPLITGDISFGLALSSTHAAKTFVYEAPWWKVDNAENLKNVLASELKVDLKRIENMFLFTEILREKNRDELREISKNVVVAIQDASLQENVHKFLAGNLEKWDSIGNTLKIAQRYLDQVTENDRGGKAAEKDKYVDAVVAELVKKMQQDEARRKTLWFKTKRALSCAAIFLGI